MRAAVLGALVRCAVSDRDAADARSPSARIAHVLGGDQRCRAEPRLYTVWVTDVPRVASARSDATAPGRGPAAGRRAVNVLVIDDEDDTRQLIAEIITKAGYSVETAADGQQALDLLRSVVPDLILLDIQMPVLDGASFRQEQRRNPEWIRIPTAVITGSNEEPQLDPAIAATLRKPVGARQFLALVRQHCTLRS